MTKLSAQPGGSKVTTPTGTSRVALSQATTDKFMEMADLKTWVNDSGTETRTTSGALTTTGLSNLDSTSGAIAATLADGAVVGQEKIVIMTVATNVSTVTVTNHITSPNEVFTFDAVEEYLVLKWTGSAIGWITIDATATV
jgi:hypothetical protein